MMCSVEKRAVRTCSSVQFCAVDGVVASAYYTRSSRGEKPEVYCEGEGEAAGTVGGSRGVEVGVDGEREGCRRREGVDGGE